ncbi:MAG: SpoIIE family protein phosphatase [Alphaproteobacteria bacterium]|nr:SpoIIE family protein phosphatase [Alphaproteobacteria bacterium]MDD9920507.1 SpoIIE family protein phosphatase [Alphaproteobacteria bacterium]
MKLAFQDIFCGAGVAAEAKKTFTKFIDPKSLDGSLFVGTNSESLLEGIAEKHSAFLIGSSYEKLASKITWPDENQTGQLALLIVAECRFLYGNHISEHLAEYLASQNLLGDEQRPTFHLILQEALANAIEHGNLGLSSLKDRKVDEYTWLDKYYARVKDMLANTDNGRRTVTISIILQNDSLLVWVEDEGGGFDINKTSQAVQFTKVYNRGLGLSMQLSEEIKHDKGGRRCFFKIPCYTQHTKFAPPTRSTAKEKGKILIVDDQKINRDLARHFLTSAGYKNVETAVDGKDAMDKVEIFNPDLILLDIIMPEMDGFETCTALKANPETSNIPVLFLSGLTDANSRTQGYRLGAVDYVNKPIDRNEMVARADVHILNGMMLKATQVFSQRLVDDLKHAQRFQASLLPSAQVLEQACERYDISIHAHFNPCDELAGDYWHFFPIDDENIALTLADFTGHGVLAALNTVNLHALFNEFEQIVHDPLEIVNKLNDRLYKTLKIEHFATLFYGVLNIKTGKLRYVSCGAPAPIIIPADTDKKPILLDSAGLPVGLMDSTVFSTTVQEAKLDKGDRLFLYSDALEESLHAEDTIWEEDILIEKLSQCSQNKEDSLTLINNILRQFNRTVQKPLKDDLTLVSIQL